MIRRLVLISITLATLCVSNNAQDNRPYQKWDDLCIFMNLLIEKKSVSQTEIDSLLVLISDARDICYQEGITEELFNKWVRLASADERFLVFFLKLKRTRLRNVEFGEGRYVYVVRIALANPKVFLSYWDSIDLNLKMTVFNCLDTHLAAIESWDSLSPELKEKLYSQYYTPDLVFDQFDKSAQFTTNVAFLDSLTTFQKNKLISLRKVLEKR